MNRLLLTAIFALPAAAALGQEGSLMLAARAEPTAGAATLNNSAWTYQALPPEAMVRSLEKESIITVLVDYRTVMMSEGEGTSRKTGSFSTALTDMIKFDGKDIFPSLQSRGDPTVAGTVNSQLRTQSEVEQRESLTFAIAAKVVDIRPNGNLVLEGRRHIRVNEEVWMIYLTGTTPRQMIGPDWTVRDTAIADLRVEKYEEGSVRDGYSRGWLNRWYGKYKAF